MKRVIKIEGPFNKSDELVDILVPGETYYYLGTPNREMDDPELLTMKWAYKIDAGPITLFLKSKYSKLKGKSKMSGSLPPDIKATSATVYAYFNRPSDDISMRKLVQQSVVKPAAPATAPVVPAAVPAGAGILNEMKALVDRNIPYSQSGERSKLSAEGLKNLDCSETVAIYLHKLGVMPTFVAIHTGLMTTEGDLRKAIGSNNIDFVPGSEASGFKPMRGDVFVWRRKDGVGHTGIVYSYDPAKDLVTILEAIGNVGSADEATNKAYGGTAKKGCSRTAVYKRAGKALNAHDGWKGYYRSKNFSKTL